MPQQCWRFDFLSPIASLSLHRQMLNLKWPGEWIIELFVVSNSAMMFLCNNLWAWNCGLVLSFRQAFCLIFKFRLCLGARMSEKNIRQVPRELNLCIETADCVTFRENSIKMLLKDVRMFLITVGPSKLCASLISCFNTFFRRKLIDRDWWSVKLRIISEWARCINGHHMFITYAAPFMLQRHFPISPRSDTFASHNKIILVFLMSRRASPKTFEVHFCA